MTTHSAREALAYWQKGTTPLTAKQNESLRRCSEGASLRFEASEIITALVASGYARKGIAGVLTVTARGREYLRARTSESSHSAQQGPATLAQEPRLGANVASPPSSQR